MRTLTMLCAATVSVLTTLVGCGTPVASSADVQPGMAFADMGGGALRVPVKSMKEMRQGGTILQQYDFSCGSAALASLLTYHYSEPVSENEVLEAMYSLGDQAKIRREGFSMLDMKRYLNDIGYEADGFEQPLDKLAQARLPAIVLINEGGYHHFVVIKGIDSRRVLLGDPARGIRAMQRADFEAVWVGKLLFVIHNHQERVRFNLSSDWRAAPRAPLFVTGPLEGAAVLPKSNPGDF